MTPSRLQIADALKHVIDPEVGINIVDLGLVYDIQIEDDTVALALTMTTPACPMSSYIKRHAATMLDGVPGVERVQIDLVWEPPWSPAMIEPEIRARHFGAPRRSHAASFNQYRS